MILLVLQAAAAQVPPVDAHYTAVQIGAFVGALIAGVGGLIKIVEFVRGLGKDKDQELREGQETILKRMGENREALQKEITERHRETCEDIVDLKSQFTRMDEKVDSFWPETKITEHVFREVDQLRHRHAGELQKLFSRVDRLEASRGADVERIVRAETNLNNIEKSVGKIEHAVETLGKELGQRIDGWADKLATSIREVRDVRPRS